MRSPIGPPLRMGICSVTGGTVLESWVPKETGKLGKLPSILRPLDPFKDDILVLSNLAHAGRSEKLNAHQHCAYMHLTGADHVKQVDGKPFASQSVDQRAAELVADQSLLPSVQIGYAGGETSYFFNKEGRPVSNERDPRQAFDMMFKGRSLVSPNWARRMGASADALSAAGPKGLERQVVDLVLDDAKRLTHKLGRADQNKLNEFMEAVFAIEQNIAKVEQRVALELLDLKDDDRPQLHAPTGMPTERTESTKLVRAVGGDPSIHARYIEVMSDLMVLALQTDTTRVCSLTYGSDGASFPGVVTVGYEYHAHTLEHQGNARRVEDADPVSREGCRQIHEWYSRHFANMLGKMKAIDEGGTSLLDNTMLLYTSYMADGGHGRRNYPVLLAGKAGGTIQTGRHIAYQPETPMANLYVEMLARMGDDRGEFGNSRTSAKAAYDGRLPDLG